MTGTDRPPLFQFWHDPLPPSDVAALMAGWRGIPGFDHRLFDSAAARAMIAAHFGAETLAAYDRCAVPAMQADLFRYCALWLHGGVWMDADQQCRGCLRDFLHVASGRRGLLMRNAENIANGVIHVTRPQDPLIAETLRQAEANIAAERSSCVWDVTGPGIMTRMWSRPGCRALFEGFAIVPLRGLSGVVGFPRGLAYKSGPQDWRRFMHDPDLSIFR